MNLYVYNLLNSESVALISDFLLAISICLAACAFIVRWILKKPISFGLNIIWDRLERAKNLRLLPQYSAFYVYKILDSLAIIPWLICPFVFIYYVHHWNNFSQYIFGFKDSRGEIIISTLSNYILFSPIILPFITFLIISPFLFKLLFNALYLRIRLPEPKDKDKTRIDEPKKTTEKRRVPLIGYAIFISAILFITLILSNFSDMLIVFHKIAIDVVEKINSRVNVINESITLYLVATSVCIFIFSMLIPIMFFARTILEKNFGLKIKKNTNENNKYQTFPSWWKYTNLFYGGFVSSVGLTIFTVQFFPTDFDKPITLQLIVVNAILDGATLAITRKILFSVSLPWSYVKVSLKLEGLSDDAREVREIRNWRDYSRVTKWRIYNSSYTEDRMRNLLFRLATCLSEIRRYGKKEEENAFLEIYEEVRKFMFYFDPKSLINNILHDLLSFRLIDVTWKKKESADIDTDNTLKKTSEASSNMGKLLYIKSNNHPARKVVFFGFPIDFLLASLLAVSSLYLGLFSSIYHMDFSLVLDLYMGFFSEARMGQFGGYILLMHSALLPTTFLWFFLMLMVISSYIIAPIVNSLTGIRNNIGKNSFAENGVIAASKGLTNTAAFFAFWSSVPSVILFFYSVS